MTTQLKKIRKSRGMTQAEVAAALGIDFANYNRLENGHTELTFSRMQDLAKILHCEPVDLIVNKGPMRTIRVRGHVQAGMWSESFEWPEEDWYDTDIRDMPQYRKFNIYGAETRGASMDKFYPEGTVVAFTNIIETEEGIRQGEHYIVERESPDGMRETTIKRLSIDPEGKLWLVPESSDPRYTPIAVDGDEEETIRIIGHVIYVASKPVQL